MKKIIYLYTTKEHQNQGLYKVGETEFLDTVHPDVKARKRIREQNTGNPDELELIQYWVTKYSDKQLHKFLDSKGYSYTSGGTEWRKSPNKEDKSGLDILLEDINEFLLKSKKRDSYELRNEQKDCLNKACSVLDKGTIKSPKKFLIDAKMRFGKTFTSFNIVKELGLKKVLVLTYTPYVRDEWIKPIENHVHFDGWNIFQAIDFTKKDGIKFKDKNATNVLFASAQDMLDYKSKEKWEGIRDQEWDVILFDEFDFGGLTEKSLELLKSIKSPRLLCMTGTAFKIINNNFFNPEDIYTWSYEDEVRAKIDESKQEVPSEIYKWLPSLKFAYFSIGKDGANLTDKYYFDETQKFSFSKFFEVDEEGKFVREKAVEDFIDGVIGKKHDKLSPFSQWNLKHSFWLLPSVAATKSLKRLLEKYRDDFKVIAVSGDAEDSSESDKKIIQLTNNKDDLRTIVLSCQKHTRGITVPKWDSVFFMKNIESPQEYFQAAFRCQSANKVDNKQECYVIDFDFSRVLSMAHERTLVMNNFELDKTEKALKHFFECAPILHYKDNQYKPVSFEQIWKTVKENFKFSKLFTESYLYTMINFNKLNSKNIQLLSDLAKYVKKLKNIGGISAKDLIKLNEEQEKLKGKDPAKLTKKEKAIKEAAEKTFEELKIICKDVIKDVAKYIFITMVSERNFKDIMAGDAELFKDITNISMVDFKAMVDSGIIDSNKLNEAILGFHEEEKDI